MNTLRRGKPIGPSVPYSRATALSVSASNGNLKPYFDEKRSWLSRSCGEIAEHLGVELVERVEPVVVVVELLRAHRRVVAGVEDEHDRLAGEVRQRVVLHSPARRRSPAA